MYFKLLYKVLGFLFYYKNPNFYIFEVFIIKIRIFNIHLRGNMISKIFSRFSTKKGGFFWN